MTAARGERYRRIVDVAAELGCLPAAVCDAAFRHRRPAWCQLHGAHLVAGEGYGPVHPRSPVLAFDGWAQVRPQHWEDDACNLPALAAKRGWCEVHWVGDLRPDDPATFTPGRIWIGAMSQRSMPAPWHRVVAWGGTLGYGTLEPEPDPRSPPPDPDAEYGGCATVTIGELWLEAKAVEALASEEGWATQPDPSPNGGTMPRNLNLPDRATWDALAIDVLPSDMPLETMIAAMLGARYGDKPKHPRYSEKLAGAIKLWILLHNHPASDPPSVRELCDGTTADGRRICGVQDVLPNADPETAKHIANVVKWANRASGPRPKKPRKSDKTV